MKKLIALSAVLFAVSPVMAQASCENVTEEISQKIISNGVPADGFTLTVVPGVVTGLFLPGGDHPADARRLSE